ncbi:MAG TPA: PP2C family serine/threonine-protein phosphatase [Ktedonobacteraceae bacterium]|nr:PP2C family serine/threonine-protein phosphatase [Ktedonobacteraceae bacterium]
MHLKLTAADKTDVGKQREQNEDSAYKRIESLGEGDRGLLIVADGMGGYQAGEIASKLAVETISKAMDSFFKPIPDQPTIRLTPLPNEPVDQDATITYAARAEAEASTNKTVKLPETPVTKSIEDQFTAAIQQANKAILRYGEQKSSARGLGCTLTAALIQNDQAYIANVGDSRTYLLRDGKLILLTKDHSLVAKLVEAKQIEPDEVYSHPQRNLIYRSLGAGHKTVEVDIFYQTLRPGDTLLLCSDGLWEMVRGEDLLKELSVKSSPQHICDILVDLANANGGEDNITAVVVQISAL